MAEVEPGSSVVTEECLTELLDFFMKSVYKARNMDRRVSIYLILLGESRTQSVHRYNRGAQFL